MRMSKISILCASLGVAIEQGAHGAGNAAADAVVSISQTPGGQIVVTVSGAVLSYLAVEFIKGFIEGWRAARAKRAQVLQSLETFYGRQKTGV